MCASVSSCDVYSVVVYGHSSLNSTTHGQHGFVCASPRRGGIRFGTYGKII